MTAHSKRLIVLIGLRASGKSSLATALSHALGVRSVDLDDLTATRLGFASANEAFVQCGEVRFRTAEAQAMRAALAGELDGEPAIIALGGGTPTAPGVAELLQEARKIGRAFVVFLDPPLSVLAARLALNAGGRPSITGRGLIAEIEELARQRRPLYAALADLVVVRDEPLADTVSTVTARLRGRASNS
ncbi:MAG: shikimate kinase [Limnohabitans sp.]|nr:shikimate kinase [Limnohabitans sp.]